MKTIGIKLADGSFYPVLEDNTPSEKQLELTTAHNNQTKVMVDLYRSRELRLLSLVRLEKKIVIQRLLSQRHL